MSLSILLQEKGANYYQDEECLSTLMVKCLINNQNWSERSACAALGCWHKVGGFYFRYIFLLVLVLVTAVVKIPEGVVVGFQIFAWAPN